MMFLFRKRWWKFRWQSLTRGWNDSETWNLDHTIAEFSLPRLKRFKETTISHPGHLGEEGWNEVLDKMIFAMQAIIDEWEFTEEEMTMDERREHWAKVQEGCELFGKWFRDLWD